MNAVIYPWPKTAEQKAQERSKARHPSRARPLQVVQEDDSDGET